MVMDQLDGAAASTVPNRKTVLISIHSQDASKPHVRSLAAGQVVCREGDPAGPAWVIISGSVRVYRRDLKNPNGVEELGRLGPGAVFGEMASFLDQPRSATVQAVAPTEVLEMPGDLLHTLAKTHPALLRVIVHSLKERAGLSQEDLTQLAGKHGIEPAAFGQLLSDPTKQPMRELPTPPHDPRAIYVKRVPCPACDATFPALLVKPNQDQPRERESDFHQLYETQWKPYEYEVWVCPACLYAAFPQEFPQLTPEHRERVPEIVESVTLSRFEGERPDFNAERTLDLREKSLHLAQALYQLRGAPLLRMASIYHRLAWCARERQDEVEEQRWLREALQAYSTAYREESLDEGRAEIRVQYLCAELARRTGDAATAVNWFSQVLRHAEIKQHPAWERMARDGWALVREAAA